MASVKPGVGLGFFKLGASLRDVMATLRSCPASAFPKIQVVYSDLDPINYPVVLVLEENGLRLQFDGQEQYLRVIEILKYGKTRIIYKNTELGKQGPVSFRHIYNKVFGPTYPGVYYEKEGTYVLSYPGIAFTFEIPSDLSPFPQNNDEFIKYLSSSNAPSCSSTAIFKGHSWPEAKPDLFKPTNLIPDWRKEVLDENKIDVDHILTTPNSSSKEIKLVFASHSENLQEFDVKIDETQMQDIIMNLGPPCERFFKQDSRLLIHDPSKSEDSETDLFFNYCQLGFDVCFDTLKSNAPVKKMIIHGNVPGSLPFQKYKRCRWKFDENTTSEHNFFEYASNYTETDKPMILNRQLESPSSSVELVGDTEEENNSEQEDWGQTDLYGTSGCVFEVLKNGAVVSLTVY